MQADPTDVAIPSRSRARATDDPSVSWTTIDSRSGQPVARVAGRPPTPSTARTASRSRSRSAVTALDGRRPLGAGQVVGDGHRRWPRRRSRSLPGGDAPASRRAAGRGGGSRGGRRARRSPSAPRTCGRPGSTAGRRRAPRDRGRSRAPPGRHRRGRATPRRLRTPVARSRRSAGSSRPRCWRA